MVKGRRKGKVVGTADELTHGTTKKFVMRCHSKTVEGFLVGHGGRIYAYVNRCCHMSLSLDWVDNQFLTEDGRYILCANHGATYEPDTGECVWGPCFGAFLKSVPIDVQAGRILAFYPEEERLR